MTDGPIDFGPVNKEPLVYKGDAFGDPNGLGPAFDELAVLVRDHKARPHDRAARDRMEMAANEIIRIAQNIDEGEDLHGYLLPWTLIWLTERTIPEGTA